MAGPPLPEAPLPPLHPHHPEPSKGERGPLTTMPQVQLGAYGVGRMGMGQWEEVCGRCGGSGGESAAVSSLPLSVSLLPPTHTTDHPTHTRGDD